MKLTVPAVRRWLCVAAVCAGGLLGGCVGTRARVPMGPAPVPAVAWEQRMPALQQLGAWAVVGRAAAAVGGQGWQASLNWRQNGPNSEVHLAGPLGVGASILPLAKFDPGR